MNYIVTTESGAVYNVGENGTVIGGSFQLQTGKLHHPRVENLALSVGQHMQITGPNGTWVRSSAIQGVRIKA